MSSPRWRGLQVYVLAASLALKTDLLEQPTLRRKKDLSKGLTVLETSTRGSDVPRTAPGDPYATYSLLIHYACSLLLVSWLIIALPATYLHSFITLLS